MLECEIKPRGLHQKPSPPLVRYVGAQLLKNIVEFLYIKKLEEKTAAGVLSHVGDAIYKYICIKCNIYIYIYNTRRYAAAPCTVFQGFRSARARRRPYRRR